MKFHRFERLKIELQNSENEQSLTAFYLPVDKHISFHQLWKMSFWRDNAFFFVLGFTLLVLLPAVLTIVLVQDQFSVWLKDWFAAINSPAYFGFWVLIGFVAVFGIIIAGINGSNRMR